jgi:hypothetical protein
MAGQPQASDVPKESDALLRQLIAQVPGIVWSTDCELRITSIFGAGLALEKRARPGNREWTGGMPKCLGEANSLVSRL